MASRVSPAFVLPLDMMGAVASAPRSRKGVWIGGAIVVAAIGLAIAWAQMQKSVAPAEAPVNAVAAPTTPAPTATAPTTPMAPATQPAATLVAPPDPVVPTAVATPGAAVTDIPKADRATSKKGRTGKPRAGDTTPTKTPEKLPEKPPAKPTADSIDDPFAN